ncbi:lycopene cyclase domain-containing protein [Algoriphagus zhangzhouensis]|uniref:Lycopene cyclase domain-containing protein n=1 Tax=Algoriphagus zhangzhouensis TaxID=1073327 RepID=A0A1M7ZBA5_9BACT|nr:lycopene cyclase domain-containing protein [Algoriphagus zhangzhouensis]TDY46911.1 lycopene cyclase domain-containing protein [Algoriphagus zhangzhouensis]SHO62130.1 lycopene cyclase domain-containing protein [Algoriphagus zhangzhouensis]
MEKYLYLILNILTISFPLIRSFEPKINYSSKWSFLFPAIFFTGAFFLVWDHWFTVMGVWEFNPRYLVGIYLFQLPIEEWLFFLTVPFACVFIYEVLIYFFPKDYFLPLAKPFVYVMVPFLLGLALLHLDKWYTSVNFIVGALVLVIHFLIFNDRFLGRFIFAYLVTLIPFMLCNGILTGGITEEPVVIYNNAENLGIRIWTIPIEDTIYCMTLLLMNVSIFESLRSRKQLSLS